MNQINQRMGTREWLLLFVLSVLWGGSFFFVGVAVKALPPFTLVVLRVGLAALALHLVVRGAGLRMPTDGRTWAVFFGMGLLNNLIPFTLIVWGQSHIASGLASILNASTPLFTLVVAHLLTRDERLSGAKLAGVLVGFVGVAVIIGVDSLTGVGDDNLAQLAILGAALSYAFAGVFGRRFARMGVAPLVTATGQVSASTLMLLPLALLVDHPWSLTMPSVHVWAAVLGLALVSTALAYLIFFRILAVAGATNVMLVTLLIPVSAILLGALFLGERLATQDFAGMILIGAGLLVIDGRLVGGLRARMRKGEVQAVDHLRRN